MGAMTTMRELAAFWQEMTAEERLDYRVRFGDDVLEVISIEITGDEASVRGYQLNGPMAQTQRDDNSRAMRVKLVAITQGGIEILDRDEPVERDDADDPGPPPTLRPVDDVVEPNPPIQWQGEVDPFFEQLPPVRNPGPADRPGPSVDGSTIVPGPGPGRETTLMTPVEEWASTAIRLPHALLQRASEMARTRMIGRNILLAHIIEQGLNDLDDRPMVRN